MKISIGCDHGALDLKNLVVSHLEKHPSFCANAKNTLKLGVFSIFYSVIYVYYVYLYS